MCVCVCFGALIFCPSAASRQQTGSQVKELPGVLTNQRSSGQPLQLRYACANITFITLDKKVFFYPRPGKKGKVYICLLFIFRFTLYL